MLLDILHYSVLFLLFFMLYPNDAVRYDSRYDDQQKYASHHGDYDDLAMITEPPLPYSAKRRLGGHRLDIHPLQRKSEVNRGRANQILHHTLVPERQGIVGNCTITNLSSII